LEKDDFDWLLDLLKNVNGYGNFNCIFSDGEFLFCYFDKGGYNGLYFTERIPPYGVVKLLDEDWEINFAEKKYPNQIGYIVAA